MHISVTAFIFCIGFTVLLGYFFAWIYNYKKLHKEPVGKPQRLTETINIPTSFFANSEQDSTAVKRIEQEKTCYETDSANKEIFIKKLLMLFRSHIKNETGNDFSICYWEFNGEGFALKLSNSSTRISENLFVLKNDKYFSKKEFYWSGIDEDAPIDIFQSENQMANSIAGVAVSGNGKLRGYITIDSLYQNAFNEDIRMELLDLATLAEEVLRTLDLNFNLDRENNLFHGMLKEILDLFGSASKGNLIANLSKILQDNFKFHRLMIITPEEQNNDKWHISEVIGEQKENFKGVSFKAHDKCLLYELLAGKVTSVNEIKIPKDPYLRRLYENEPENLELRSLFAVMPPLKNNSYPLAVVLESKNNRAVSKIDEVMLNNIVSCAALKLSNIQEKMFLRQKKESDFEGIDSNGLGELLNYYQTEFETFKNSEDSLGILFLKCVSEFEESKALDFDNFLMVLKNLKKTWNGRHLAMLGNGEFVFSFKVSLNEDFFGLTYKQIITYAENLLAENGLSIKSHAIWLSKEKMEEMEKEHGENYMTLFTISIMSKFKEMSGSC